MALQLKNVYTKEYIQNLAYKIKENYNDFDSDDFINSIFDKNWKNLELKARMRHIAVTLNRYLSLTYVMQLEILKRVSKDFYSFEAMFFQDFVEVYGLDDFDNSMKALEVFTIDSSSEFAIRAFILRYEDKTMNQMKIWSQSENEHLRRLASEGCRPRLPWAIALPKFKKEPIRVLEIIELLKNDKSLYVQKSVANNLNDISKDNPSLIIKFVQNNLGFSKELDWICKHASRTLLKQAEPSILKLFNYTDVSHIEVMDFNVENSVKKGDSLSFDFRLESKQLLGNIRLEYMIDYLKSNGKHSSKKFMISQGELKTKIKSYNKQQTFKELTTRKHYIGVHFISIIINGEEKVRKKFELLAF